MGVRWREGGGAKRVDSDCQRWRNLVARYSDKNGRTCCPRQTSAANPPAAAAAVDRWDRETHRRTDGRTDRRTFDRYDADLVLTSGHSNGGEQWHN